MSEVVYNEDLVKRVKNKYLAVNVAAKRARDINANGLPISLSSSTADKKKKSVAIATEELIEGKLHFEKSEAKVAPSTTASIFADPTDSDDEDIFDEQLLAGSAYREVEEPEEGI